jgi:branched-subunit amino acid transport protein
MSSGAIWVLIGLTALVTAAIKAAGPVALGGRELPRWFEGVIALMAPALLAALVCASAFADGDELAIGEDTAGVAVAGAVLLRWDNVVAAVIVAALVTAGLRAL